MSDPAALVLPEVSPLPVPADLPERLAAVGVKVGPEVLERVGEHLARLLAMAGQVNLTSISDPGEAWTRHGFDALTLLPGLAGFPAGSRVIDVGSGGGVPGVELALARPDLRFVLAESNARKAAFLAALVAAMGLGNVEVRHARSEALVAEGEGRAFDAAVGRAIGRMDALLPMVAPLVRPGGRVLLIKGSRVEDELADARRMLARQRCQISRVVPTPTGKVVVLAVS